MDPIILSIVLGVVAAAACVALAVVLVRLRIVQERLKGATATIDAERTTAADAMARMSEALDRRTKAETLLGAVQQTVSELTAEKSRALDELAAARNGQKEAEKQAALDRQALEAIRIRMSDWEAARSESLAHAKAAVLSTATEVSSKLIADHKRENEAAKKASEEHTTRTTETLTKHFEGVAKSVASLSDQVAQSKQAVDTVWQALSNPGGAGHYAEIGLENALKSFGLERGRDFVVEYTIENALDGTRLRPDAVVFLPFESVLVIDSKASKFLLELAQAEGTAQEAEAYANLARTMSQHLRALAGKDYRGAIVDCYRAAGRAGEIRRVLSVMYLPNEGALEKLKRADPKFDGRAAKEGIIVAGPTGLASIIGFARIEIDLGRQAENQERIVQATQQLLESVGTVVGHIDSVGRGIRAAATSVAKLTGSVNARLLPRARGLAELGVRPAKNKRLPKQVASYQVVDMSEPATIEGEAEEVGAAMLVDESRLN